MRDRLIIFTRYPEPGKAKTRLIPILGPDGAANLQRQMTERTVAWARELARTCPLSLEIHYEGGQEDLMREWLGQDVSYRCQGHGDIGVRMAGAFRRAFQGGAGSATLVGTDCPGLNADLAKMAIEALRHSDLVLGPTSDGGYCLIGMRQEIPPLFSGIPWGTKEVLQKTLEIAENLRLRVFFLGPLNDVDRPEDLLAWQNVEPHEQSPWHLSQPPVGRNPEQGATAEGRRSRRRVDHPASARPEFQRISIIIPTLDEEKSLAASLASTGNGLDIQRIVVDGGSSDRTVDVAKSCGAEVIHSPRGRARQMNAGAEAAEGPLLIFLHADTSLPGGFEDHVRRLLTEPAVAAGAFQLRLDASFLRFRIIERLANWRSRSMEMPYGDQAIFVKASLFREIGGFPDVPVMEDVELIRRLRKKGHIAIADIPAVTSARRWMAHGFFQTTLIHQALLTAYFLGVSPSRLIRWHDRGRK